MDKKTFSNHQYFKIFHRTQLLAAKTSSENYVNQRLLIDRLPIKSIRYLFKQKKIKISVLLAFPKNGLKHQKNM